MARKWTAEERAKQAALIRAWRPWDKSTGPTSAAGKARAAQNAAKIVQARKAQLMAQAMHELALAVAKVAKLTR